ncbi:MAG: D-2-hydroxyacid dehydrogenase [Woeseiaceae bacterium]|nr:D-2-hydroxyacid dehydrogenase [Woeseiaceae bacterium]
MNAAFLDFATVGAGELDLTPLRNVLPALRVYDTTPPARVVERIVDAEVVLANKVRLTRAVLEQAPRVRFIGLTATGVDNVDIDAARERGIAVCNITAYCTQSVVEHVFGTLLTLTHSLHRFNAAVRGGAWQDSEEFCMLDYPLRELSAMTMGIVGHGDLGGAVAETARHFGMDVLVAQRPGTGPAGPDRVPLDDLLARADVVSLHCPLTDETANLIGERELSLMKRDAILVNTARGGLVDSAALVAALEAERLGGAAIDVLRQEPPVDGDPLLDCDSPRLFVTPHIAWGTREARQNAIDQLADNVAAFQRGERRNRVD